MKFSDFCWIVCPSLVFLVVVGFLIYGIAVPVSEERWEATVICPVHFLVHDDKPKQVLVDSNGRRFTVTPATGVLKYLKPGDKVTVVIGRTWLGGQHVRLED